MHRLLAIVGVLAACASCGLGATSPCDDYVAYMCDCHANDPDVDCAALQNTYKNAQPAVQNSCDQALTDQQDRDATTGYTCANGDTAN